MQHVGTSLWFVFIHVVLGTTAAIEMNCTESVQYVSIPCSFIACWDAVMQHVNFLICNRNKQGLRMQSTLTFVTLFSRSVIQRRLFSNGVDKFWDEHTLVWIFLLL